MTIGDIKQKIMDGVDDQDIDEDVLLAFIQDADWAIQTWRPTDLSNTSIDFDFWDYLSATQNYTSTALQEKIKLPDNYRSFIELKIGSDTVPYKIINRKNKDKYDDHVCWRAGQYLYLKSVAEATGLKIVLDYIHTSDEFVTDSDEPEIENVYQGAYVAFGKAMYYNQQTDTQSETDNMNEFENIMKRKWQDQKIARMQSNEGKAEMSLGSLV